MLARIKTTALVVCALILSGCAGAKITSDPVDLAIKPGFDAKRLAQTRVAKAVRTQVATEDESYSREVTGVPCIIESKEFKASIVTPAKVNLPITKGPVSPLVVTCLSDQYVGRAIVPQRRDGVVMVQPSIAGLVVAAVSTAVVVERDRWTFVHDGPIWIDLSPRSGGVAPQ